MQITLKNYQNSLAKIRGIIDETKQNIVKSVDYQKIVMSWQIGEEIELHLKQNNRAEYGKKFFTELEKDTKISQRILYQMQAFHRAYPDLPTPDKKLNWSHYRNLAAVKNDETRKYLENLAIENDLGSDRLVKEISKTKSKPKSTKPKTTKLRPTRGKVFTYTKTNDGKFDLGFSIFLSPQAVLLNQRQLAIPNSQTVIPNPPAVIPKNPQAVIPNEVRDLGSLALEFKIPEIPHFVRDDRLGIRNDSLGIRGDSLGIREDNCCWIEEDKRWFTYLAKLERIVDGDTIHVELDLGFGITHHEILRLAKIAAAEAGTKDGDNTTKELAEILKDVPFLIIRTNKTDIYGRYVADVFFDPKEQDPQKVATEGTYLNQLLLDRGLVKIWV